MANEFPVLREISIVAVKKSVAEITSYYVSEGSTRDGVLIEITTDELKDYEACRKQWAEWQDFLRNAFEKKA